MEPRLSTLVPRKARRARSVSVTELEARGRFVHGCNLGVLEASFMALIDVAAARSAVL